MKLAIVVKVIGRTGSRGQVQCRLPATGGKDEARCVRLVATRGVVTQAGCDGWC